MTDTASAGGPAFVDAQQELRILPVPGLPELSPGDDLVALLGAALERNGLALHGHDIVVVAQKAVSKVEGCLVDLSTITPSPFAEAWAQHWDKDPRAVEVVLRESARIVKMDNGVLITETKHGFVCANAGVDASNVGGHDVLCLLPPDPDASARRIREALLTLLGVDVAVIVSDTFGRPWRESLTNVAIGLAGMPPIRDYVGLTDPHGYELRVTTLADADEIAVAAELVMGKIARVPVAIVRGFTYTASDGSARQLVRPREKDMFR